MSYPPATRKDHELFCTTEGWVRTKSARGRRGTDHHRYQFALPNGEMLYTRISHPIDRSDYGSSMWRHILRDQLKVSESAFWACVKDGECPDRGAPTGPPAEAIPVGVVVTLMQDFHIPEAVVRRMTKDEAVARMMELYASGGE